MSSVLPEQLSDYTIQPSPSFSWATPVSAVTLKDNVNRIAFLVGRIDPKHIAHAKSLVQTLSIVRDPVLPGFLGIALDGAQLWLIYEYVGGQLLLDQLQSSGAMPPRRALDIVSMLSRVSGRLQSLNIYAIKINIDTILMNYDNLPVLLNWAAPAFYDVLVDFEGGRPVLPDQLPDGVSLPLLATFSLGLLAYGLLTNQRIGSRTNVLASWQTMAQLTIDPPSRWNKTVDEACDVMVMRVVKPAVGQPPWSAPSQLSAAIDEYFADPENAAVEEEGGRFVDRLWRRVDRLGGLPALSESVQKITMIREDTTESLDALVQLLLDDIIFLNVVLRRANSGEYSASSGKSGTILSALMMLGLDALKEIAVNIQVLDQVPDRERANYCAELLTQAVLQSQLVRVLVRGFKVSSELERLVLASMFRIIGKLSVAFAYPKEWSSIRRGLIESDRTESQLSVSLFGVSVEDVGLAICAGWRLPETILYLLKSRPPGRLRPPRDAEEKLFYMVELSSDFAKAMCRPDPKQRAQMMYDLVGRYDKALGLEIERLRRIALAAIEPTLLALKRGRLDTSENKTFEYIKSFQAQFNGSGQRVDQRTQAAASPKTDIADEFDVDQVLMTLAQSVQVVSRAIEAINITEPHRTMTYVLQNVHSALRLNRAVLCLLNADSNQLEGRVGCGFPMTMPLSGIILPLSPGRDLFALSVLRNKDLLLKDVADPRFSSLIPAWFSGSALFSPSFMILPLRQEENIYGILFFCMNKGVIEKIDAAVLKFIYLVRDELTTYLSRLSPTQLAEIGVVGG